jgi:hypothetical protein
MGTKASGLWIVNLRRASSAIALALCLSTASLTLSCYGRFPLTKAVYNFNGDVSDDKVVRSVLMWAFIILPVYGVATLGDALIFNLIEFWTGETMTVASASGHDGVEVSLAPANGGREAALTFSRNGAVIDQERFVQTSPGVFEVRDSSGAVRGMVIRSPQGGFDLTDAQGRVLRTLSAESIESALAGRQS